MEFNLTLGALQKALKVMRAVSKPNDEDVTGQILIDASKSGTVVFVATDGKLFLTHTIQGCDVAVEGTVCVSFTRLSSFISSFNPAKDGVGVEQVLVKQLKQTVVVKLYEVFVSGGKLENKLTLRSYPTNKMFIPPPFSESTFSIPSAALKAAISKISYAINQLSPRIFIQGVRVAFDETHICFTGTDALKLSEYKFKNTSKLQQGEFIVPYAFLLALRKTLEEDSQIFFEIKDSQVKATLNGTTLHGTLSLGETYPNYVTTLNSAKHTVLLDKQVLMSTFIPFLNALNKDDHKRLSIELSNKKLRVYSDTSESEYSEELDFDGQFVIDINGTFLAQTLNSIKDDTIELGFSDENGVLIFDSSNFHDQKSLITPIKRRK